MATFSYVAKMNDGRTVRGSVEAASKAAVMDTLHRQGLVIVQVDERRAAAGAGFGGGRVKTDDLAIFARQMATLVDAGIPIVSGLEAVADQVDSVKLRQVVRKIYEAVEGGMDLTSSIAKQSSVFSPLFVSMVKAGEASGHLSEVLDRLATYLEKTAALQRKVKSACIYPAIVISMAGIITTALMIKVIPVFKQMFDQLNVDLPLPTRILMATSDAMQRYFLVGVGLMVGAYFGFQRLLKTPAGRLWVDRLILKAIIVGPIARKIAIAKFARTLSTLVRSGVPILSALEIVAETAGNRVIEIAVLQVKSSIREGQNIAGPLAASKVFPPLVVRMIAVGEQTGRLDNMLTKIAEFYEEQADTAIAGLTSAIEPVIIAILGVVVGGIVISIFLPIFKLTQVFSN